MTLGKKPWTRLCTGLLIGVAALLWGPLSAEPAYAGGCGSPATHGSGAAIAIVDACFQPTILTVTPGATVTFVNRDPFAHNVTGHLWGHYDDLEPGQRFEATFHEDGIYPFACTLHVGMTGAIVVGDGVGPGNGRTVSIAIPPQEHAIATPAAVVAGRVAPATGGSSPLGWLVVGLLAGIVLGALAWVTGERFRRRMEP